MHWINSNRYTLVQLIFSPHHIKFQRNQLIKGMWLQFYNIVGLFDFIYITLGENMKKLFVIIIGMWLSFCGSVSAAPAYGTKMPEKKEFFFGIQQYYIKHRNLENNHGWLHSHQNYLTLSYGLQEWLALDLKLSYYSTYNYTSGSGAEVKFSRSVWGGGYGFRIKAYESGPVKTVVGFQHYSIHPNMLETNGDKLKGFMEEWQASALVSYDLQRFTPYTGLRYSSTGYVAWSKAEKRTGIKSPAGQRLGLVLGLDIPLIKQVWVNLEVDGQGLDDLGLTAALNCRF